MRRRAGARIAEIENVRLSQPADADADDAPAAGASRVMVAPSARQASAVRSTSSPSKRPSTRVSPMESSPKSWNGAKSTCRPERGGALSGAVPDLLATGDGVPCACDRVLARVLGDFFRSRAPNTGFSRRHAQAGAGADSCNFLFDKACPHD